MEHPQKRRFALMGLCNLEELDRLSGRPSAGDGRIVVLSPEAQLDGDIPCGPVVPVGESCQWIRFLDQLLG